jgi:hypothetical protein
MADCVVPFDTGSLGIASLAVDLSISIRERSGLKLLVAALALDTETTTLSTHAKWYGG